MRSTIFDKSFFLSSVSWEHWIWSSSAVRYGIVKRNLAGIMTTMMMTKTTTATKKSMLLMIMMVNSQERYFHRPLQRKSSQRENVGCQGKWRGWLFFCTAKHQNISLLHAIWCRNVSIYHFTKKLVLMNFHSNWSARKSSYKLVKRHASPKYDVVQSSFFFRKTCRTNLPMGYSLKNDCIGR